MPISISATDADSVTLPVSGVNSTQSVTSSTIFVDATGLGFPVASGEKWIAEFDLDAGNALSTTGIKLAVNAPASSPVTAIATVNPDTTTTGKSYTLRSAAVDGLMDFTAADLASVTFAEIRIKYYVSAAADGNVQLQFAQSTSSATAVSLRTGSSFTAFRTS